MSAESTRLEAPIAHVLCLEDRAQIERRGTVSVPAGVSHLIVLDVTPLLVDRTLFAACAGATVTGLRVERSWVALPPSGLPEESSALRQKVQSLEKEQQARALELNRLSRKLALEEAARAEVLRAAAEAAGAGEPDSPRWSAQWQTARARVAQTREAVLSAEQRVAQTHTALAEARAALRRVEVPPKRLCASLHLTLDAPAAAELTVSLRYLVPCAAWRPLYRARLIEGPPSRVELEAFGMVWQRTREDWSAATLELSTARPTLGATPPTLVEDRLTTRDKTVEEKKSIEVQVREEDLQALAGGEKAGAMLGIDDGGEVRTLRVEGKVSVPSDGEGHRFPLWRTRADAVAERVASPELSPLVSLVSRFHAPGPNVILAGPVELVRTHGFVGLGQLTFAAPGQEVTLGFGSEDAVRIARTSQREGRDAGLLSKQSVETTVTLYVSNASDRPATLKLEERIPVSELAEVEVRIVETKTVPAPSEVTKDGIVRWNLSLGAHARQTLTLVYRVTASGKVAGLDSAA